MWLWVETGERWQAQNLNAATAAKVDQTEAAAEPLVLAHHESDRYPGRAVPGPG
ncbi:hypothetical protein ACTWPT_59510 [Nonomuraea sp. 3N208]|uniref:hypothetical protein n=1 Tax=Nonomuraea sp. 3N208 TaxID=3457421 RepID=UPI003FD277B7